MEQYLEITNLPNDILFTWVFKTLKNSSSPNLCQIPNSLSLSSSLKSLKKLWRIEKRAKTPSLAKCIFKLYWREIFFCCFVHIINDCMEVAAAVMIKELIDFLGDIQSSGYKGGLLAAGISVSVVVKCISLSVAEFRILLLTAKLRSLITLMISEKLLKVNKGSIREGNILNVVSSDLEVFDFFLYTPYLFCLPFDVVVTALVVSYVFNVSGMIGVAVSILHIPIIGVLALVGGRFRSNCFKLADKRIRLLSSLVQGMKTFKYYAWELKFLDKINSVRMMEIKERCKIANNEVFIVTLSLGGMVLTIFVSFYVNLEWIKLVISIGEMYMLISIYFSTHLRVVHMNTVAILTSVLLKKILKRISEILLLPETTHLPLDPSPATSISMKFAEFSISPLPNYPENITLASLTPKNTPILENITFKLKKSKLLIIIGSVGSGKTALLHAIQSEFFLSSGKASVSGPISYTSEVPFILSATIKENITIGLPFDLSKYQQVIQACALEKEISEFINKDETWIGERGVTLSGGQKARINLARAMYREFDLLLLDDPFSSLDVKVAEEIFEKCVLDSRSKGKTVVLVTHQLQFVNRADKVLVIEKGTVKFCGSPERLWKEKGGVEEIERKESGEKGDVGKGVIDEEEEEMDERLEGRKVYRYFVGGFKNVGFIGLGIVIVAVGQAIMQMFLYWSSHRDELGKITLDYFLDTLGYWVAGVYASLFLSSFYISNFLVQCNKALHTTSLTTITTSPSVFFDKTPSGRILTRFSKDLSNCDGPLHHYIIDALIVAGGVIASIIAILIISPLVLASLPFYLLIQFFILFKVSKIINKLRKKESQAKAPILSLMTSMIEGTETIRSQRLQKALNSQMKQKIKHYFRCFITNQSYMRFAQLYSNLASIIIIVVNLIVVISNKNNSQLSLLAYTLSTSLNIVSITSLASKDLIEISSYMLSAQRLLEYQALPTETLFSPTKFSVPEGKIQFDNVSFKYQPHLPTALNSLSFTVLSGEKIGIVGRTGSGKSSIVHVLCRLTEPVSGTVLIDGQDYKLAGLHDLRKQISVIPQSAVLFASSLRDNLDPFGEYSDDEIAKVLKIVQMDWVLNSEKGLLDEQIGENVIQLSAGERQLICVARAVLLRNKIVVLDEATSNVDLKTDEMMRKVFRKEFEGVTMIEIAHRVWSLADSEKVMVVEGGKCVEWGRPRELVEEEGSIFREMVELVGMSKQDFIK